MSPHYLAFAAAGPGDLREIYDLEEILGFLGGLDGPGVLVPAACDDSGQLEVCAGRDVWGHAGRLLGPDWWHLVGLYARQCVTLHDVEISDRRYDRYQALLSQAPNAAVAVAAARAAWDDASLQVGSDLLEDLLDGVGTARGGLELVAVAARHLLVEDGAWNRGSYDAITGPWRRVYGPLHPTDPEARTLTGQETQT